MSISLTPAAAERVKTFLAARGKGLGLRLGVRKTGCSGFAYVVNYADDRAANDLEFEDQGVKVFVDPESLPLINGTTDVCQSSRAMKPAEKEKLRDRYASAGVEMPVARDGLAVYLNAGNQIGELSMEQLKGIFTGKITNWKQVGGPDANIIVYSRENSSGTYVFFKEVVLENADFTPRAQTMPGTAAVVNAVAKDKLGIDAEDLVTSLQEIDQVAARAATRIENPHARGHAPAQVQASIRPRVRRGRPRAT